MSKLEGGAPPTSETTVKPVYNGTIGTYIIYCYRQVIFIDSLNI